MVLLEHPGELCFFFGFSHRGSLFAPLGAVGDNVVVAPGDEV